MRFREQTIRAPEENTCTAGYLDPKTAHLLYLPVSSTIKTVLFSQKLLSQFFFFCILFIYFLFTGIVQTTYRSKHTNTTKFTTTTLITKKTKKENRINK